jgi:threonine dehydratase
MLSSADIRFAHETIAAHVRRTPTIEVDGVDFGIRAAQLVLKLESLQHAGSFKARGAFTSLLTRKIPHAGVAAASGGNHGAAVAFAAMKLKIPAKIFVPSIASPAKVQQITDYGAELVISGERYADALAASEAWVAASGALPIHAFDQFQTVQGQGTVGLEFEQQAPQLTTLLVAVGGGGVAAESLAPRRIGEFVFPLISRFISNTVLVSDEAILDAQRRLWTSLRVVAEPGGAAALAALTSGQYTPGPEERVGVLICGGNTAIVNFKSA